MHNTAAYLGIIRILGKSGRPIKVVAGEKAQRGGEDAGEVVEQD